jgi:hypothetical protein
MKVRLDVGMVIESLDGCKIFRVDSLEETPDWFRDPTLEAVNITTLLSKERVVGTQSVVHTTIPRIRDLDENDQKISTMERFRAKMIKMKLKGEL